MSPQISKTGLVAPITPHINGPTLIPVKILQKLSAQQLNDLTKTSQPMREEMEEKLNFFNLITQPSKKVFSHWMGGTFWMKH